MSTDNIMVYNWADIEKAIELVKAFPWERKLKKAEYWADAREMLALANEINAVVKHPYVVSTYEAEAYAKKAFTGDYPITELKKARKWAFNNIRWNLRSLANYCLSGEFKCDFGYCNPCNEIEL